MFRLIRVLNTRCSCSPRAAARFGCVRTPPRTITMAQTSVDRYNEPSTANTSSATLVDPIAGPSTLHVPPSIFPRPDFSRRASEATLHDIQNLGLRVLLPDPVRRSFTLSTPRLSTRHTSPHIPPIIPANPVGTLLHDQPVGRKEHDGEGVVLIQHLRRPLLPLIHILLLSAHLGISTAIPYLLVKHLIQPMILWLILVVCLVLQAMYLAPGITLEVWGMLRGRPMCVHPSHGA